MIGLSKVQFHEFCESNIGQVCSSSTDKDQDISVYAEIGDDKYNISDSRLIMLFHLYGITDIFTWVSSPIIKVGSLKKDTEILIPNSSICNTRNVFFLAMSDKPFNKCLLLRDFSNVSLKPIKNFKYKTENYEGYVCPISCYVGDVPKYYSVISVSIGETDEQITEKELQKRVSMTAEKNISLFMVILFIFRTLCKIKYKFIKKMRRYFGY